MFEKNAEEYFNKTYNDIMIRNRNTVIKAFQDGAEFGYNKANEWHWTKKEGYPKDNKVYLALIDYGIRGTKYEVRENLKDEQPYNLVKWKEIE